ncbi:nucleotidyltransferase family protein [Iodobacter sp. CM08]|uniref:nucleotidyltransferase family protein n=1 Tax=Iodobacter sp. CM08 TaxID=3085902 RepID=UPI002981F92A|nr:nucleotidyltransferase family protein [Iodobacter sp. CM08]MDW5419238.1 nucleotidyltransferase family protein [Iodobacter sp. CM08]
MQAKFLADVLQNSNNAKIIARWDDLGLKEGWLVAGCLFQTIWNTLSGQAPESHIKDYDFFYFDATDLSAAAEYKVQQHVEAVLADLNIRVEVANQARVHCWYEADFGHPYPPLSSSKEGIDRFLIPATCVGINNQEVYAPNGLQLLYQGLLTPNPITPHEPLFTKKAASYQQRWPWLRIQQSPSITHSTISIQ